MANDMFETNIPPTDMAELALKGGFLSNHLMAWVDAYCMIWDEVSP